jgi:metal-dependent amidase/aminoacylase/carboxypeptidase family protein
MHYSEMMRMRSVLKGKGDAYREQIVSLRRHLHQFPVVSGEEHATSETVQEKLDEHSIPFSSAYARMGVLGVVEGDRPGTTVALRANIDALPIQEEENDHSFVSKVDGVKNEIEGMKRVGRKVA